jgi:uncharacterized protein
LKTIHLFLLFIVFNNLNAQKVYTDSLRSIHLKNYRTFTVSLPKNYDRNKEKTYPLIVAMDGEYLFDPIKSTFKYGNYWSELPEAVIIGINQNNKNEREADCVVNDETGLPAKTGANFFDFLNTELLPNLEVRYRLGSFRVIVGHDITAAFANLYLFREDNKFTGFISLSPEFLGNMASGVVSKLSKTKKPTFYYFACADIDEANIIKKTTDLDASLSSLSNTNANHKFESFKDASHYSYILNALPNAFYDMFKGFAPISIQEYNEKIATLPGGYVDYLNKKYETIEKKFGLKMTVRFNDIKAVETAILKNGNAVNELEELAVVANKNYPKAMLGEYYVAQYFEKKGDLKRAQKSYLAAYKMNAIGDLTKEMVFNKSEELKNQIRKESRRGGSKQPEMPVETETPATEETKK